jgi:hypothetical protein
MAPFLGGNNSGYSGNIVFSASSAGVMLLSPQAQTGGGLLDVNGNDRNLWLATNTALNPYTFWTGSAAPGGSNPMAVNFRNAGTSGIFLGNGDVFWNPVTSGNDYLWDASRAGSNSEIRINGSNDPAASANVFPHQNSFSPTPRTLTFGNSTGSLILAGSRIMTNGGGGTNPGRVVMNFALSDNGLPQQFSTSLSLLKLTRAADSRGGTAVLTGTTAVTGGALSIAAMDRVFNGWFNLTGGVVVLDGISWSDFTTDRSAGYRGVTGTVDTWGISSSNGGFAARGTDVTIFMNASTSAAYGTISAGAVFNRDFALGAAARADDKSLYANARVIRASPTFLIF